MSLISTQKPRSQTVIKPQSPSPKARHEGPLLPSMPLLRAGTTRLGDRFKDLGFRV